MALTPVWLFGAGNNTGFGTTISSSNPFTPPPSTLLLVAAEFAEASAAETTGISDTVGGLTWTEVTNGWQSETVSGSTQFSKTSVFWAVSGASPPSGSVTVTVTNGCAMDLQVVKVPGAKTASPVGTSGFADAQGSFGGTTQSMTATATLTPASDSCMVAVLGQATNGATDITPTDDAAFTNLFYSLGGSTAHANLDCSYNGAGASSVTWSVPASAGQFWMYDGVLVEIKAPPPPPPKSVVAQKAALIRASSW